MKLNIDKLIILVAIFSLVIWPVSGKSQTGTFGDITGDGKVDLQDSIVALQVSVQISPSTPVNLSGDVNGDYRIGLEEVIYAIQKVAGFHNHPPELNPIGNKTIDVDSELSFSISASDPDGDSLSYNIIDLPSGATFDTKTLTFSWTPNDSQNGTYNLTFTVEDIYGALDSETITIIVNDRLPDAPCCPHPKNGEDSVSIYTFLSWGHSATIMKTYTYSIYLGTSIDPPLVKSGHETLFYFPDSLNDNTTYFWKINAVDDQGLRTEGPLWHFHTSAEGGNRTPDRPSEPWPEDGAANIATTQLSWTCSDADGDKLKYHVFWGLTGALTNYTHDIDTTAYTLPYLTCWYRHYWKIIAEDEHGAATEGPLWYFDAAICVDNRPPDEPTNPSPSDGATCVDPVEVNLTWECSDPDGNEITYDLYWGTTTSLENGPFTVDTSFYQLTDLRDKTRYYWQIIARDEHNYKTEGPVWTFWTGRPPDELSNPSPSDGATGVYPVEVSLTWECSDPDGDSLTYSVSWGTTPEMTSGGPFLPYNSWTLLNLAPGTQYYWRVTAKDEHCGETPGPVWNFTTKYGPVSPLIIVPEFGEGRRYSSEDSVWRSLDWELSYLLLRETLWNTFIDNPGVSSPESAIGQMGFVEIGYIPDTDEWFLNMRYEGFETDFQYSLPSKVGYSSASISIIIGRQVWVGEFVPYTLQISSYGQSPLFELEVTENYPFFILKEYEFNRYQFAALPWGNNVPLYVTTELFKKTNPLPGNPPSCAEYDPYVCDENYEAYFFSSTGGIFFFITLKD